MLKVQDGCNNFCSYCIIPYARGPVRSEPLDAAVAQARALAATGYREIVITGIEIASWGWDLKNGQTLTELAEALCAAVPNVRIRLGSLEPRIITRDFCLRLSRFPNLCPQFHLSLQSGSDTVLVRMRRKYDTARYAQSVALLRESFPGCALTTDLIVGFPGETEAELEESLAFCRQCGFAAMHIFPYSRRPGTPADKMPGQLTKAEKEARSARPLPSPGRWSKPICLRKSEPHRKCFGKNRSERASTPVTPPPTPRSTRRETVCTTKFAMSPSPASTRTDSWGSFKVVSIRYAFSRSGAQKVL